MWFVCHTAGITVDRRNLGVGKAALASDTSLEIDLAGWC